MWWCMFGKMSYEGNHWYSAVQTGGGMGTFNFAIMVSFYIDDLTRKEDRSQDRSLWSREQGAGSQEGQLIYGLRIELSQAGLELMSLPASAF